MFARVSLFAILLALSGALQAQYPAKPVTLVVAFPPASDADLSARNLGQNAQKYLNQPVVVANRPGASGAIGTMSVRTAPADGRKE